MLSIGGKTLDLNCLHLITELFLLINILVTARDGFLVEEEGEHYFHQIFLSDKKEAMELIQCL